MKINNSLTENDNDKIEFNFQLEHHFQHQQTNENGWILDKIIAMKIFFLKLVNQMVRVTINYL